MPKRQQRQRHGVHKNLAEGIGGLLVGAAAVLLLRQWLRTGPQPAVAAAAPADRGPGRGVAPKPSPESDL